MRNNLRSRVSWLLPGLFLFFASALSAQPCSPFGIGPVSEGVTITGLWSQEAEPGTFQGYFTLKSEQDATFDVTVSALQDAGLSALIDPTQITLIPATLTLEAGKTQQIKVVVSGVAAAGSYQGLLQVAQSETNCFRELPFFLDIKMPGQTFVVDTDQSLIVKTVEKSWLMNLLPSNIRQEGLFVRVENTGPTAISFRDYSLSLKGTNSQHPITKGDVKWENPTEVIPAGGVATMIFTFTDSARKALQADEYSGSLRLHARNYPTSLSVGVTMFARTGVLGAILAIFIGILVGRMLKSVNESSAQIELMKRFIPLRASIDTVEEPVSKRRLLTEANALEAQIDAVKGEDQVGEVEAKFAPLENKVTQIHALTDTYTRLAEQFTANKIAKTAQQPLIDEINRLRDAILDGKEEQVQLGWSAVRTKTEEVFRGESTRSLDGSTKSLDPAVSAELDAINSMLEKSKLTPQDQQAAAEPATFLAKLERWFFRFFNLLGGVKVNARVKFGLFRPIVALVTFIVVLLLGFQEIYLNGGDTFGAEGLYDHLKLFAWGLISDVFSRTLTDEKTMASISRFVPGT